MPINQLSPKEKTLMPIKIHAGVSKKRGLPAYSSVSASCHVELELDNGLLQADPEAFRAKLRELYAQCAASVEEELGRQVVPRANAALTHANGNHSSEVHGSEVANGNGSAAVDAVDSGSANGTAHNVDRPPGGTNGRQPSRPSTRQMQYAQDLAARLGFDGKRLEGLSERIFDKPLSELASGEASGLIRALQDLRGGRLASDAAYRAMPE
jgi:hypothetical protein